MNGREIEGSNISMTKLIPNVDDCFMPKVQGGDNDEMDAMTQTQLQSTVLIMIYSVNFANSLAKENHKAYINSLIGLSSMTPGYSYPFVPTTFPYSYGYGATPFIATQFVPFMNGGNAVQPNECSVLRLCLMIRCSTCCYDASDHSSSNGRIKSTDHSC